MPFVIPALSRDDERREAFRPIAVAPRQHGILIEYGDAGLTVDAPPGECGFRSTGIGMEMTPAPGSSLTFARLPDVPLDEIVAHMSDPRIAGHMPLLTGNWDRKRCADFVSAKEEYWRHDGLGHWAILHDGAYAGWGGFQKEGKEWDFGLVLKPDCFGLGARIVRDALDFASADERISFVTFLLPPSRRHLRGLVRLGARFVDEVEYEGVRFRKYRLDTQ